MSLNLVVGIVAELKGVDEEGYQRVRTQLETVNEALQRNGLITHIEPEELAGAVSWSCEIGISSLHHLRRIAAYVALGRPLPAGGGDDPDKDPVVKEYYGYPTWFAHLMLHSDCEGFYVPLDFVPVVMGNEDLDVPGGMIGSSYRLKEECEELARHLELPLELDPEDDAVLEGEGPEKWRQYAAASHACLALYRGACKSIEMGAALVFC